MKVRSLGNIFKSSSRRISFVLGAALGFSGLAASSNASLQTKLYRTSSEIAMVAQEVASSSPNVQKRTSTLVVENSGKPQNGTLQFPLKFAAAPGETVGSLQAIVTIPSPEWKFKKIELTQGSRLKVSTKQKKIDGGQSIIEVNISGGSRVIRDGIIATILFSIPASAESLNTTTETTGQFGGDTPKPDVRLVAVMPPETDSVSDDTPPPIAPPPPPEPNPSTGCFFFSH